MRNTAVRRDLSCWFVPRDYICSHSCYAREVKGASHEIDEARMWGRS